ncbi:MAG: Glutaryl-CoA dehydrogenase, partial [uncultured Rubrobacteraceae bacterium]
DSRRDPIPELRLLPLTRVPRGMAPLGYGDRLHLRGDRYHAVPHRRPRCNRHLRVRL